VQKPDGEEWVTVVVTERDGVILWGDDEYQPEPGIRGITVKRRGDDPRAVHGGFRVEAGRSVRQTGIRFPSLLREETKFRKGSPSLFVTRRILSCRSYEGLPLMWSR
jgi:hypothetical protein